jgi:hypothetical protein
MRTDDDDKTAWSGHSQHLLLTGVNPVNHWVLGRLLAAGRSLTLFPSVVPGDCGTASLNVSMPRGWASTPAVMPRHTSGGVEDWASNPCGKDHVANVPDHLVLWRVTESSIVNKPIGYMAWSCPSTDGLRRVPVCHVDMEVPVADDLEKHDLAVVRHIPVGSKAADGPFQILNIRRPRVTEKLVPCRDRHGSSAAAVVR